MKKLFISSINEIANMIIPDSGINKANILSKQGGGVKIIKIIVKLNYFHLRNFHKKL